MNTSRARRDRTLASIAMNLHHWDLKVVKFKAVYHAMNMFSVEGQNFICECWMPYKEMGIVQAVLERSSVRTLFITFMFVFLCVRLAVNQS